MGQRRVFISISIPIIFTPIPCTCTSLRLYGVAMNYDFYFYLHGYAGSCNLSCLDPFFSCLLTSEEKKNIWFELELNPGPLASQATALTTSPWLLASLSQSSAIINTTAGSY